MAKFDYVPPDKEIVDGKLVPKRPDPYVTIEQLKLKIADLHRRIDMSENAELASAAILANEKIGLLERQVADLKTQVEGAKNHIASVEKEREELRAACKDLRAQVASAGDLPPVTSTTEDVAAARKELADAQEAFKAERENMRKTILDLRTRIVELEESPAKGRKAK